MFALRSSIAVFCGTLLFRNVLSAPKMFFHSISTIIDNSREKMLNAKECGLSRQKKDIGSWTRHEIKHEGRTSWSYSFKGKQLRVYAKI